MNIDFIGIVTIAVGFVCLLFGSRATFATFVAATLLGSAAAITIGAANIQPAHLLLGFVVTSALFESGAAAGALASVSLPRPGFWLACLVLYGVLSAVVLPQFLGRGIQIVPLGSSEYGNTGSTVPLGPVPTNFTQSVYLVADLICFMITAAVASTAEGFALVAAALVAYVAGNVFFALLDVATYYSGTQAALEFIRNAQYTLHNEEEVSGLKRIVGSFTEASSFARSTLGALAFAGTLWICGRRSMVSGALALASLVLVVLSTSSSGLAGTPPVLILLYITAVARNGIHPARPYAAAAALCAPLFVGAVIVAVLLNESISERVNDYLDMLIFGKSNSDSGLERGSWNVHALENFYASNGLGVGLGTVRTSGLFMALLANVGVLGLLFYALFVVTAFGQRRGAARSFPSDVRLAARNACIGLTIGDLLVASTVEQGLVFYICAGLACAEPEPSATDAEEKRMAVKPTSGPS